MLADSVSEVFFALDRDLKCTYWNKAAESVFGVRAADAVGKAIDEIFPAAGDSARSEKIYREVLAVQQIRSFTGPHAIGDKKLLLEVTAYPSKEGISVFASDLGERRRSEETLQRLAAIVQSSDDAILSVTPEGCIASWNRGAERLFGYSASEIMGKEVDSSGSSPVYSAKRSPFGKADLPARESRDTKRNGSRRMASR